MKPNKLMQLLKDNFRADATKRIRMEASSTEAHVYVNDVIDSYWGASAASLITALEGLQDKVVHLHINSPGGDVFEARAMAAAVVAHPGTVVAHIDGICASAATYLALACSQVRMTDGGLFMVHNSWTMAYGNKEELRTTADLLDKIDGTIIADYARKTGASNDQVVAWMDATTWFTAQEALDAKFIDAIDPNTKQGDTNASARWNLSAYPNAPKAFARNEKPQASVLMAQADAADVSYLQAMVANGSQAVQLSKNLILANGATPLRGFAEEVIDDQSGDVELMKLWIESAPVEFEDDEVTDQALQQIQLNRNRLRLISPI